MEKAIVVVLRVSAAHKKSSKETEDALEELNQHLSDGWRVKHSFGMGGTDTPYAASLLILERDE